MPEIGDESATPERRQRNPDWTAFEIAAIADLYFHLLREQVEGRPHRDKKHLIDRLRECGVERSRGSVDFKMGNISAVLTRLGMPRLDGYVPAGNLQRALLEEVERRLDPGTIDLVGTSASSPAGQAKDESLPVDRIFVPWPQIEPQKEDVAEIVRRLARKFDPAVRDDRNRRLGEAGERFVLDVERRRLASIGLQDRIPDLRWSSKEDGDGLGYDIRSFENDGSERLIEVKTTNGCADTPFFLTENERFVADAEKDRWHLYRVHAFANGPRIAHARPPLEESFRLTGAVWKATPHSSI